MPTGEKDEWFEIPDASRAKWGMGDGLHRGAGPVAELTGLGQHV